MNEVPTEGLSDGKNSHPTRRDRGGDLRGMTRVRDNVTSIRSRISSCNVSVDDTRY